MGDLSEQLQGEPSDQAARDAHELLGRVWESITDAFVALDRAGRYAYVNQYAERLLGRSRHELLGRSLREVFPAGAGGEFYEAVQRAQAEGIPVTCESRLLTDTPWVESRIFPSADGLSIFHRDISERKAAEEALQDATQRTSRILESITDAFATLDRAWRFTSVNSEFERQLFRAPGAVIGRSLWEEFPAAVSTLADREFRRAVTEQVAVKFEQFYPPVGAWFEVRAFPSSDGLSLFFQNISERKQAEDALRRSREDLRLALAAARLGTFYCDYPLDKIVWNDICKAHFFLPSDAEIDFDLFYSLLHPEDRESTQRAIARAMQDRVEYDVEYRALAADGRTRWINAVGRFDYDSEGTPLRFDGITLDISARKSAEEERERLLTEQQARAEREALLNRIGQTIRSASDPKAVQEAAVRVLGEALGVDRCYVALYDIGNSVVDVVCDWHQAGMTSIQGYYPFPNTAEMFRELYQDSDTSVINDAATASLSAQTRANMQGFGLRARVSLALLDGDGLMATLTVAMTSGPRAWTEEEIALVEAVGTQMRTAVEMVRITQRERNIAQQLQKALQPELPGTVPGLALTNYYKAALAEAGVGGDFYDVYAIEKGRTALAVGDLSGKGLAAAAQVATVRNMLRYAFHSHPTLVEAVTDLNRILAENNLLTGFTTLFVGSYDSAARLLKYVNCGQEPALIRRSGTGAVEQLVPTGPVLGTFNGAQYTESSVALAPGDAVVIFTDGMTEVGPRTEMLGIEGIAALLERCTLPPEADSAASVSEALKQYLIAGIDSLAQAGARDDVCLLIGVVQ